MTNLLLQKIIFDDRLIFCQKALKLMDENRWKNTIGNQEKRDSCKKLYSTIGLFLSKGVKVDRRKPLEQHDLKPRMADKGHGRNAAPALLVSDRFSEKMSQMSR